MDFKRRYLVMFVISAMNLLCQGLEDDGKSAPKGIENTHETVPFQARGFGQSFSEEPTNLQAWKDWMQKRAFGSSFGSFGSPDLQSWKDWMEQKRTFNPQGSFTDLGHMDGNQFQKWSDWMSKRGFGPSSNPFNGRHFDKDLNLQSWYDLAKRNGYFGKNFLDIDNNRQMQTWNDWIKKSFGGNNPFNYGPKPYFTTYDNLKNHPFKRSDDKRQFQGGPTGFGSFHRYFTDGLQDWRSSFKGAKRGKEMQKEEKN